MTPRGELHVGEEMRHLDAVIDVQGHGEGMGCAGRDGWGTSGSAGCGAAEGLPARERGMPRLASEALFGLVGSTQNVIWCVRLESK